MDFQGLIHPSVEFQGILLHCSLDSPILVINFYRHPNTNTPFLFYSNLFAVASGYKYVLILGDFNAHHLAWGDSRVDGQGEDILRACDAHNLVIMNDGHPTFLSSSGHFSSSIDLSICSRALSLLASSITLLDLHGSDHFPISVTLAETSPATFLFTNRIPLSSKLLDVLHLKLISAYPKFIALILSSSPPLNPLQKYDLFCSFLMDTLSSLFHKGVLPPQKKLLPHNRIPSPWWNHTCAEAVEKRSTLLRLYKANPTWDNWSAYKRGNVLCRRTLKREKRKGWLQLCSEFTHKTPTSDIWRFIRAYKNKSFFSSNSSADYRANSEARDLTLGKLCPPSCLHNNVLPSNSPDIPVSSDHPFALLGNPFTFKELESAIYSSKAKSSPGLDRFDYKIIRAIPSDLLVFLLEVYTDFQFFVQAG